MMNMAWLHAKEVQPQQVSWDSISAQPWDALVVVGPNFEQLPEAYQVAIEHAKKADQAVGEQLAVVLCEAAPGGRLVLAPTGALNRDYDDVRRFYDAARGAVARIAASGAKAPVLLA